MSERRKQGSGEFPMHPNEDEAKSPGLYEPGKGPASQEFELAAERALAKLREARDALVFAMSCAPSNRAHAHAIEAVNATHRALDHIYAARHNLT